MVRQHGDILAQHRWQTEERVQLYSASKTFTSMAIGIAIEEKYVSLDTPVVQFFPKSLPLQPDSRLLSCTVRHLLTMTSGHGTCPLDGVMGAMSGFSPDREKDWVKLFFQGHMQYEPGTRYFYDNSATYLLSAIVSRTTGRSVRDFLLPRVLNPWIFTIRNGKPALWESAWALWDYISQRNNFPVLVSFCSRKGDGKESS